MRRVLLALLLALSCLASPAAQRDERREVENVFAFARLYGVVRYFYPSDAAAALDWNRFAVHGVKQVRDAADAKSLQTALNTLFSPLGPGLTIGATLPRSPAPGTSGGRLVAWRYFGPGFSDSSTPGPYRGKRTNRTLSANASIDGFVTLMQSVPAETLRGKTIRLRGQARVTLPGTSGSAALWLRVDRPDQAAGFFDNMGDRPIREAQWREYVIEGVVAEDATAVAFGVMASGTATADFDRMELSIRGASGEWTPVPIGDSGFEAAADAGSGGWFRAGTSKTAAIARPSGDAPEGRQFVRFAPSGSVAASAAELFDEAPPVEGAHVDVDLGSGLKARVPLALPDAQASARSDALDALRPSVAQVPDPSRQFAVDVALADVVVAWNVFRHFYPYWKEAAVDWDARLGPQIEDALRARTRDDQRDALRRLVADARDGHGLVVDTRQPQPRGALPIVLGAIGDHIVITGTGAPADAPVGAIVSAIDGTPAGRRLAESMQLVSGSAQWKQVRALREIASCAKGALVTLLLDSGAGAHEVSLQCGAAQPPAEKRSEPIAEVAPGVWYVDLTRARVEQLKPMLEQLSGAPAVVFDVRGYPTDAGAGILPHLTEAPERDRWMHVPKIAGPFGQFAGWHSVGWNVTPAMPRLRGRIVFMTDGRAISYAESVMGYVADRKLGTIVGSATAGTNGNVAVFDVPGGFRIAFTGMRVTRHDGHSPFHLIGVQPDVRVTPTVAAIRAGRDEVLERAVELVRRK
jgi:hypothetical protein